MPASASPPFVQSHHNGPNPGPRTILPPLHRDEGVNHGAPVRLGSGMSISAMLGGDSASSRESKFEANGAQPRPSSTSTLPPSQSSPGLAANGQSPVNTSLDRYKSWYPDDARAPAFYSSTVPPRPFSESHTSESSRFGPPLSAPNSQTPSRPGAFPEISSPHDHSHFGMRKYSLSDPKPLPAGPLNDSRISGEDQKLSEERRRDLPRTEHKDESRPRALKHSPDQSERGAKVFLAPKMLLNHTSHPEPTPSTYPFLTRAPQSSPHNQAPFKPSDRSDHSLIPATSQPRNGNIPNVTSFPAQRPPSDSPFAALRSLQESRKSSIPLSESPEQRRESPLSHLQRQLVASAAGADDSGSSPELSRRSLSLINDSKRGRISPMPQAVQGAQPQLRGPASEPGIKNEFARMFSGIGSGVGSAVSTPVPPDSQPLGLPLSPIGPDERDRTSPLSRRKEIMNEKKPRNTSRVGRRGRRLKDEEVKKERDDINGAALARTLSGRGQKRTRNNYQNVSSTLSHG